MVNDPPFQDVTAVLQSLQVTPGSATIAKGTRQQFTARATFADGGQRDLSSSVAWNSTDVAIATVSASGQASGVAPGQVTITASLAGISSQASLTVSPATIVSIAITLGNQAIAKGTPQQFTAVATLSDGSTDPTIIATWDSSVNSVATIDGDGLASSKGLGSTTISATVGGVSGYAYLTVTNAELTSIEVTPANANVAKGLERQFTAMATFGDGTQQNVTSAATWSSTEQTVATIAPGGLATGFDIGDTSIRASFGGKMGAGRTFRERGTFCLRC